MAQKTSPFIKSVGSPSLQKDLHKQYNMGSQIVPSINIQLKNQLTLNVLGSHNKQGSLTDRDMTQTKKQYDQIMRQIKDSQKLTKSKAKFQTNITKTNYVPGHYHSYSNEHKATQSKRMNSSLPKDSTKKSYDAFQTETSLTINKSQEKKQQTKKPKSLDYKATNKSAQINKTKLQQSISKLKVPSEPSDIILNQNYVTVLSKQKQSAGKKSERKSPRNIEQNFKKLLQQYAEMSKSGNQKQFKQKMSEQKMPYMNEDPDISGFKTERMPKKCVTILLFDQDQGVTEYQFDSTTGTTDQLTNFLTKQINIPIIGFQTLEKNVSLDFYLTLKNKELTPLTNMTIKLQPIIAKNKQDGNPLSLKSFQFLQCIGMGGFSRVYLVRSKLTGHYIALKMISKKFIEENQKQSIVQNERDVMCQITMNQDEKKKKFVCQLECAFETKTWVCFGMEYCPGGELFNQLRKVKKMTEDQARPYFVEVLFAVGFLHENNILYRDIKPENILIDVNGHAKVADFGLARPGMDEDDEAYSFCGSPEYMAPEMLKQEGHTHSVDYYCLGALLYELITGLPPFYSRDTNKIFQSILHDELQFPSGIGSAECRDLIRKLLAKNSNERLGTIEGVDGILRHPWIQKCNVEKIFIQKYAPPFEINLTQFNFDPNELKKGEGSFKQELSQSLSSEDENIFKAMFKDFVFIGKNLKGKEKVNKQERRVNSASNPSQMIGQKRQQYNLINAYLQQQWQQQYKFAKTITIANQYEIREIINKELAIGISQLKE